MKKLKDGQANREPCDEKSETVINENELWLLLSMSVCLFKMLMHSLFKTKSLYIWLVYDW